MRASVAEWSKATDSSSVLFGGVGSNPTGCIAFCYTDAAIARLQVIQPASIAQRLVHLLRKQKVVSSNLTAGSNERR